MSIQESTLALAGVFQAVNLVKQVARQGLVDQQPFEVSINSVLKLDADSTEAVYGGAAGVKIGLQTLVEQFGGQSSQRDGEIMRYVLGITFLERKLIKNPRMLDALQEGIKESIEQSQANPVTHPDILSHLAQLYSETISSFDYRIQVSGEPRYLKNPENADRIRALLLAAIRSAVLWRQTGGRRLQFLWSRKKIVEAANSYLEVIRHLNL